MNTRLTLVLASLALTACASGPLPPDWQSKAHGALNTYTTAYLSGKQRLADTEFSRARRELASTGRFDLVAKAELTRCAVQVASLEFNDCPGFQALTASPDPREQAYAAFLQGQPSNPALLPEAYRNVERGGAGALPGIESPVSRLIAAGVLMRSARLPPAGMSIAIDTASAQGWRRALLAWLGAQAQLADNRGDRSAAEAARNRIKLLSGEL